MAVLRLRRRRRVSRDRVRTKVANKCFQSA